MLRKYIDCRDYPSEMHCTVAIAADSEKELEDAAVQHAVSVPARVKVVVASVMRPTVEYGCVPNASL